MKLGLESKLLAFVSVLTIGIGQPQIGVPAACNGQVVTDIFFSTFTPNFVHTYSHSCVQYFLVALMSLLNDV
ncbi:hypothetical protein ABS311_20985 [Catenovulum sediminis]|uniref:Secreted protein n=1 Tax=Catenovulum sediminis TaxID=1740262 RepID=A0ABV1RN43_9ALTE